MSDWRKPQLVEWFKKYHPDKFNAKDNKDVLWAKALEIKKANPQYVIDDMIKAYGMVLLRTPPYHCEINPIGKYSSLYFCSCKIPH